MLAGKLTNTKVKRAQARQARYSLADGGGLALYVNPNGSKWWRFRYRIAGTAKMLSLGVYPAVTLKVAREQRDKAHCRCLLTEVQQALHEDVDERAAILAADLPNTPEASAKAKRRYCGKHESVTSATKKGQP